MFCGDRAEATVLRPIRNPDPVDGGKAAPGGDPPRGGDHVDNAEARVARSRRPERLTANPAGLARFARLNRYQQHAPFPKTVSQSHHAWPNPNQRTQSATNQPVNCNSVWDPTHAVDRTVA